MTGELSQEEAFQAAVAKGMFAGLVSKPDMVRLTLPYPPSLNSIFQRFKGSHLSEKYRLWRDAAHVSLNGQNVKRIGGPVTISVALKAPDKRRRDLDNVGFKAVIDLLVKEEIIDADDSRIVKRIEAQWVSTGEPCVVTVRAI